MAKKLVFDATDADTLAASDYVGAHLYAGGTLLTGGDGGSDALVAANIDAADARAFGYVFNGTTWDRLRGTSGAVHIADGGNSITVDATDLDIRDLTAASDSVAAWLNDGSGNAITSSGGAIDVNIQSTDVAISVNDAALANTAVDNGEEEIDDTVVKVVPTDLSNRKYLYLYNKGSHEAYLGKQSGLTISNGFPIYPGVYLDFRAGAAIALYGVTKSGKVTDMRNLQFS